MTPFQTVRLPEPRTTARDEVRNAARALSGAGDLHDARVSLKRARALIRLCPDGAEGIDARGLRRELRTAGKRLSAHRDREAALEIISTVEDRAELPDEVLGTLDDPSDNGPRLRRLLDEVSAELEEVANRVKHLGSDPSGAEALKGLARGYRKARREWKKAVDHPTAGTLHELRKRTKVFRYQMEWFAPLWPGVLDGWVRELHTMTDELGQVHDVTVLRRSLAETDARDVRERVVPALVALHDDARNCRHWSLARGARLFAEKPKAFRSRMGRIAGSVPPPTFLRPPDA